MERLGLTRTRKDRFRGEMAVGMTWVKVPFATKRYEHDQVFCDMRFSCSSGWFGVSLPGRAL